MKILSKSSEETVELGEKLGKWLKGGAMNRTVHGGEVVALYGELGGGKTQFTKGIARGLGISDQIISPTFVVRREYRTDSRRSLSVGEIPASRLDSRLDSAKRAARLAAGMTHAPLRGARQAKGGGNDKGKAIRRDSKGKKLSLLHYDFYRFEVPDKELVESLQEGINSENVTVIEWADRVEEYLPKDTIKVTFHYVSEDEREIEIENDQFSNFNDQPNLKN